MKRREFLEKAGIGSAALVSVSAVGSAAKPTNAETAVPDTHDDEHEQGHHHEDGPDGPLASATVSFGSWSSDPPLDRYPNISDRTRNVHQLIPHEVTIKAGGTVNFIISGFHYVLVYGPGTKPEDIHRDRLIPNLAPPRIDDADNRVYRGLDPASLMMPPLPTTPPNTTNQSIQDRVEVVNLAKPGRFLVICGILPHFFDAASGQFIMFGYVKVVN